MRTDIKPYVFQELIEIKGETYIIDYRTKLENYRENTEYILDAFQKQGQTEELKQLLVLLDQIDTLAEKYGIVEKQLEDEQRREQILESFRNLQLDFTFKN